MSGPDDVLAMIDGALHDAAVGPDAMRWTPDEPEPAPGWTRSGLASARTRDPRGRFTGHPVDLQIFDDQPLLPTGQPRNQTRNRCTRDEFETWQREASRMRHDHLSTNPPRFGEPFVLSTPGPPCLGCATPRAYIVYVEVDMQDDQTTVTFHPCGCAVTVYTPKILDHIPSGTRRDRTIWKVITGEALARSAAGPAMLVDRERERAARDLGQRPHVVQLLTPGEARELGAVHPSIGDDDRVLIASILTAIPRRVQQIVFRPAPGLPPGFLPPGFDGHRWENRPGVDLINLGGTGDQPAGYARPTGRIEIDEYGVIAEVWEVTQA